MGLDMYLTRKVYVKTWDHTCEEDRFEITITRGGKPWPITAPIIHLEQELGYWRKANAIHAWFVKNVQNGVDDCRESYVSRDKLTALLETVQAVLDDPKKAMQLLPPQEGFFFGSTAIDGDYMYDLEHTKKILQRALEPCDASDGVYYQASR